MADRLNHNLADPRLSDWAHVLYNQAVLTFGARVDDPAAFVSKLNDLLVSLAGDTPSPAATTDAATTDAVATDTSTDVAADSEQQADVTPPPTHWTTRPCCG
jgi:molecular chaperone HtpG